ncbi:MAG: toprim domain-containing protein [Armatimonadetes bacterium]|nr:toprim domain-containing protein [Armatimonadota bacterium]
MRAEPKILDVAQALGINLKGKMAHCINPNHPDTHPSLMFSPQYNRFKCFSCGIHGNVYELVKQYLNIDFKGALEWLRQNNFVERESHYSKKTSVASSDLKHEKKTIKPVFPDANDMEIYDEFIHSLSIEGQGREYLLNRGFTNQTIMLYQLKYLDNPVKSFLEIKRKFGLKKLEHAGLVCRGKFVFHQQCIVIPFWDENIYYIQARNLSNKPKIYNLVGKTKPIYNFRCIDNKIVWLTEGVFDALSLLQVGIPAMAILGTSINDYYIKFFEGKNVILFLDFDASGQRAIDILAKKISGAKIYILKKETLDGNDPNEIVTELMDKSKQRTSSGQWS